MKDLKINSKFFEILICSVIIIIISQNYSFCQSDSAPCFCVDANGCNLCGSISSINKTVGGSLDDTNIVIQKLNIITDNHYQLQKSLLEISDLQNLIIEKNNTELTNELLAKQKLANTLISETDKVQNELILELLQIYLKQNSTQK